MMGDIVSIVEVGPRDGLQNEKALISVTDRIAFIGDSAGGGAPLGHTAQDARRGI